MIHVFVSPGAVNGKSIRSVLYDTVSPKYAQFLREELLPEVYAKYNIRKDAYSRAIQGQSSGGIAAFNVAWHHPEEFSRVYTVVASYTALQWRPGELEGGNVYPFKVRREPKRNLRVWMNDGSEDQETGPGQLAAAEHSDGELAEDARLRLQLHLRRRLAPCGAGGVGAAGVPHLALARLRPGQNRANLRTKRGGEGEAAVPRPHLQPLRLPTARIPR